MKTGTLYIQFRDVVADLDNAEAVKAAIETLIKQLHSASEWVREDPAAIYELLEVQTGWHTKPTAKHTTPTVEPAPAATNNPPEHNSDDLVNQVFNNLKRTEKSEKIVRVFVNNSGNDIELSRLIDETGLSKVDLCSWLAQTGKKVKAITNPARGTYKFDPDKL